MFDNKKLFSIFYIKNRKQCIFKEYLLVVFFYYFYFFLKVVLRNNYTKIYNIKNKILHIKINFKTYLKILKIDLKHLKFPNRLLFYKNKIIVFKNYFSELFQNNYQTVLNLIFESNFDRIKDLAKKIKIKN